LPIPWGREKLVKWIDKVLSINSDRHEKLIKLMITGGIGPDSLTPSQENPTIVILCDKRPELPQEVYEKGIAVTSKEHERFTPKAKSVSYLAGVMWLQEAREAGAREVIFYVDNQVFEGVTSNVFAVIDGELCTPASNVLDGITKHILLALTKDQGLVSVKDFDIEAFRAADEVFITSSSRGVLPVTTLDSNPVGNGEVGPKTKEMMTLLNDYIASGEWKEREL
jgi:branched-subunit amino acid aminotransferase/4-amino-4-deoxychorismate lyase